MADTDDFRPVRDFNEPDPTDAHADDAIKRLNDNAAQQDDRNNYPAITSALELAGLGFSILPVKTNDKAPVEKVDWQRAVKNHPQAFLRNPGTRNYGILPPEGCVILDVDKDAPTLIRDLAEALGSLPETRIHLSPNGQHWVFRWPDGLPRPRGAWWGQVVARWPLGDEQQGYVVGPGSEVTQDDGSVGTYTVLLDSDIAPLPESWAQSVLDWKPARQVTPGDAGLGDWGEGEKYVLPDLVPSGGRYAAILAFTASLYNEGLTRDQMWHRVLTELVPRFVEPLSVQELRERFRRATARDMESRLGPRSSVPLPEQVGEAGGLFTVPLAPGVVPPVHTQPTTLVASGQSVSPVAPTVEPTEPGSLDTVEYAEAQPVGAGPQRSETESSTPPPIPWAESAVDLLARLASEPSPKYLVENFAPAGGLHQFIGHPKTGKSLAVLQMLASFVSGQDFLGHPSLDEGTRIALYVTTEGTRPDMQNRIERLLHHFPNVGRRMQFVYMKPFRFDADGLRQVNTELAAMESRLSALPKPHNLWLVLDPLRNFMRVGADENEAKYLSVVKEWVQSVTIRYPFVTVTLVHHLRKAAEGDSGLEASGSGALYGMVDGTVNWRGPRKSAAKTLAEDEGATGALFAREVLKGTYRTEPRMEAPTVGRWLLDDTGLIVPDVAPVRRVVGPAGRQERSLDGESDRAVLDVITAAGSRGATVADIVAATGLNAGNVRFRLHKLGEAVFGQTDPVERRRSRYYVAGVTPDGASESAFGEGADEDFGPLPGH